MNGKAQTQFSPTFRLPNPLHLFAIEEKSSSLAIEELSPSPSVVSSIFFHNSSLHLAPGNMPTLSICSSFNISLLAFLVLFINYLAVEHPAGPLFSGDRVHPVSPPNPCSPSLAVYLSITLPVKISSISIPGLHALHRSS